MMNAKLRLLAIAGALTAIAGAANAEEHEIRMLNRGEAGVMVFEPAFIRAAKGDTIRFVAADAGHNAETIKGMVPDGAEPFKGKINEEIAYELTTDGVYGIKCAPHYGMGMVALIAVGEATNGEEARGVKHPGKARTAFGELFGQVVAGN